MIAALVRFLRDNRNSICRTVEVKGGHFDPTFGWQSRMEEIEVIDFDSLLSAMDEFAESFKEQK